MKTRRQLLQAIIDARLAEIDTSAHGNAVRAFIFSRRIRHLTGKDSVAVLASQRPGRPFDMTDSLYYWYK